MGEIAPPTESKGDMPRLEVVDLCLSFGGVQALRNVSFGVRPGELLAVIGPNGAGKTCVLNCISGFYRPNRGQVCFEGRDLTRLPAHSRAKLGIARVFQNVELYESMSTLDNLMAARHVKVQYPVLLGGLWRGRVVAEEVRHREAVEEIIDFLELQAVRKLPAGSLAYGLRKRVDLGRALALEPRLLLLDEPMAGMGVDEKQDIVRYLLELHITKGLTMVLVEHDMEVVMSIADRVIVLDFGEQIADGAPAEIRHNPRVITAYLGKTREEG